MWRNKNKRFLAVSLALLITCASALSASHFSAHQLSDSHAEEACLALHAVGLDTASLDSGKGRAVRANMVWRCELTASKPFIRLFFKPSPRAPPFFS